MDASKDSSSWLKKMDISSLKMTNNLNQLKLIKDIWLIQKNNFNSRSQIRKDKGKLFSNMIMIKMLNFKGVKTQEDLKQITFIYKQIKIKLNSLIRVKSNKLIIIQFKHS